MDNTNEFVAKFNENKKKQEKNQKQGQNHPEKQLPNQKH